MPSATIRAFCFASGHIEFGKRVPSGALPIAYGPEQVLRDFIEPLARHGYSTALVKGRPTKIPGTERLLVPGLPEAPDQGAALTAFQAWLKWIGKKPPKGIEVLGGR
ncbi:hypothetical protein IVB08_34345 [Bradyrhizobium sp. 173]|uniref:hypothetical protein n=1 Tax=Bradyrhizobium sp. 173 TaxID=2782644 RepID=UPI001FF8DA43|nr:hypothetical protein [Bradyrhizobium sp. 173]MCK1568941.1 hypothetical protein [Bradyrhizobium sp. 173]